MSRHHVVRLVLSLMLVCLANRAAAGPIFFGLGDLPGDTFDSSADSISADGTTVVGQGKSGNEQWQAYRWTLTTGMVALGDLPGGALHSGASGVSHDGSVIVGTGVNAQFMSEGFRWTASNGLLPLGYLPGGQVSIPADVSDDGAVVVGVAGNADLNSEAFRWTASTGLVGLGDVAGGDFRSRAEAVSGNGQTIAGWGTTDNGLEALRWTADSALHSLGFLPGGSWSRANAVSFDGRVIAGESTSTTGRQGFRWTEEGGLQELGAIFPLDMNRDGSVIVGYWFSKEEPSRAVLWDQSHGLFDLKELLEAESGLDLSGWTLNAATGISADGMVITGRGINPQGQFEAWIAVIPEPTTMCLLGLGAITLAVRRRSRRNLGRFALTVLVVLCCFPSLHFARAQTEWTGGPVLIGGDDMDAHFGGSGEYYIREGLNFLAANVCDPQKRVIVCLGCHDVQDPDALSAFTSAFQSSNLYNTSDAWNVLVLTNSALIDEFFTDQTPPGTPGISDVGIIYLPSSAPQVAGGITLAQVSQFNARSTQLKTFVDNGGGLFTHTLWGYGANSYVWFSELFPGLRAIDLNDGGAGIASELEVTCTGMTRFLSGLTRFEADGVNHGFPWHTYFRPATGFPDVGHVPEINLSPLSVVIRFHTNVFPSPDANLSVVVLGAPARPLVGLDCTGDGTPDICQPESAVRGPCCHPQTGECLTNMDRCDCESIGGLFGGEGTACQRCANDIHATCTAHDCPECSGGPNDGRPCSEGCPDGVCTTTGFCQMLCEGFACCNSGTGACRDVIPPGACGESEYSLGPGSSCGQNCCTPVASPGGADAPTAAVTHMLEIGEDPHVPTVVSIRDSREGATGPDPCTDYRFDLDGEFADAGWWHAFEIDKCALITVAFCCTEPAAGPIWGILFPALPSGACGNPIFARERLLTKCPDEESREFVPATGRGRPVCTDTNPYANFPPLPAGIYYYPVYAGPDAIPDEYSLHITAAPCPRAGCCLPSRLCITDDEDDSLVFDSNGLVIHCSFDADCPNNARCSPCAMVDRVECHAQLGYWYGADPDAPHTCPRVDCRASSCRLGVCCIGNDGTVCLDRKNPGFPCDPDNSPTFTCVDEYFCETELGLDPPGVFVSAECDFPKKPCPVCPFIGDAPCQAKPGTNAFPSKATAGVARADDFIAGGDQLRKICVGGAYVSSSTGSQCVGDVTSDSFTVTVYEDVLGLPGLQPVAVRLPTQIAVTKAHFPFHGAFSESWNFWEYQLRLDASPNQPINLVPGRTYWLEIVNAPSVTGSTCEWRWATTSAPGNGYSLAKEAGTYGLLGLTDVDMYWCLDIPGHSGLHIPPAERTTTVFVDASRPGGEAGHSWETAFRDLQDALRVAYGPRSTVKEIWVAEGTYSPDRGIVVTPGDRTATFLLPDGVSVLGGFPAGSTSSSVGKCAARDPALYPTILSGDLNGDDPPINDNSYHVVSAVNVGPTAILDGFTITGGDADGPDVPGEDDWSKGAGLYLVDASPQIRDCTITGNRAWDAYEPLAVGAGVYVMSGEPRFESCTFSNNSSLNDSGGAIYADSSDITLRDCSFKENTAGHFGGAVYCAGGSLDVISSSFDDCSANFLGGAVHAEGCTTRLVSTTFFGNTADSGGAVSLADAGTFEAASAVFSGNLSDGGSSGKGGAVFASGTAVNIKNSTLGGNVTGGTAGGVYCNGADLTIYNSILWGNRRLNSTDLAAQFVVNNGTLDRQYSCVQGGGTSLDINDPQFVDPDGLDGVLGTPYDNLRVYASSPMIDVGGNSLLPQDTLDVNGNNIVSEQLPLDVRGSVRVRNATGAAGAVVDIGAYEFDCVKVPAPAPDPAITESPTAGRGTRNRYLSFIAPEALAGIRVRLAESTLFPGAVGRSWWVQAPAAYFESSGCTTSCQGNPQGVTFRAALLSTLCSMFSRNWSTEVIHIFDDEIVPSAGVHSQVSSFFPTVYEIQSIDSTCSADVPDHFSAPVSVRTSKWGDVIGSFDGEAWTLPNGSVDILDLLAIHEKISNQPPAIKKARADIAAPGNGRPDAIIDFPNDIIRCQNAFSGQPYPFGEPGACQGGG